MEEVFIKVGENSIEEVTQVESGSINDPLLTYNNVTYENTITGCLCVNKIFAISFLLYRSEYWYCTMVPAVLCIASKTISPLTQELACHHYTNNYTYCFCHSRSSSDRDRTRCNLS